MSPVTLAQLLPEKVRQVIYAVLPTLVALELLFDFIPEGIETKVVGVLVILGFGVAFSNTPSFTRPQPVEQPPEFP